MHLGERASSDKLLYDAGAARALQHVKEIRVVRLLAVVASLEHGIEEIGPNVDHGRESRAGCRVSGGAHCAAEAGQERGHAAR